MRNFLVGCCGALLLITLPVAAQEDVPAQTVIERTLQIIGLDRLFSSVQPLVKATLAEAVGTDEPVQQLITETLSVKPLQQALVDALSQSYQPAVYARALEALNDPAIAPAKAACAELPDFGIEGELTAYQAKLATRSPRPIRTELARQMDTSARTSSTAASLYTSVERIIVEHTRADLSTEVPWAEIAVQRRLALEQSVLVWYLYCGRFAGDEVLSQWVAYYNDTPVQQVLDDYQQALAVVLEQASLTISQQARTLSK